MNEHEQKVLVQKHEVALFGDGNGNKGIVDKINEMYDVFNKTKLTGKVILTIIVTAGAIALAITNLWNFVMQLFQNKP